MPDWLNHVLQLFSLSSVGLPAIFVVAFVSATILPMATEPVLFGFVKLNPDMFLLAIVVATIGNTFSVVRHFTETPKSTNIVMNQHRNIFFFHLTFPPFP